MNGKIEKVLALTASTTACTVKVSGLAFLIQNRSESATVYFKEKRMDGADATSSNGYALGPGKESAVPLVAMELSLAADNPDTDVRLLILDQV